MNNIKSVNHGLNIIFTAGKKFTPQSYCPLPKKPYVISSPYPILRVIFLYCLYPILSCSYHILLLCVYPIIPRAYPNARTSSRMYIVRIYSILCDCACIISYLAFNISCDISYPYLLSVGFAFVVVFM